MTPRSGRRGCSGRAASSSSVATSGAAAASSTSWPATATSSSSSRCAAGARGPTPSRASGRASSICWRAPRSGGSRGTPRRRGRASTSSLSSAIASNTSSMRSVRRREPEAVVRADQAGPSNHPLHRPREPSAAAGDVASSVRGRGHAPAGLRANDAPRSRVVARLLRSRDLTSAGGELKTPGPPSQGSRGSRASEEADKPGSVDDVVAFVAGHPFLQRRRHRRRRAALRGHAGRARPRGGRPLALLRVGFALPSTSPPTRCALAAPFHPCPAALRPGGADCSLWHFPSSHPDRSFSCTHALRSPDFPPVDDGAGAPSRPAGVWPLRRAATA